MDTDISSQKIAWVVHVRLHSLKPRNHFRSAYTADQAARRTIPSSWANSRCRLTSGEPDHFWSCPLCPGFDSWKQSLGDCRVGAAEAPALAVRAPSLCLLLVISDHRQIMFRVRVGDSFFLGQGNGPTHKKLRCLKLTFKNENRA